MPANDRADDAEAEVADPVAGTGQVGQRRRRLGDGERAARRRRPARAVGATAGRCGSAVGRRRPAAELRRRRHGVVRRRRRRPRPARLAARGASRPRRSRAAARTGRRGAAREQERDRAADERADRGEQLEDHPEPQVRDVALGGRRRRAALLRHDHRDERDADRLAQRQPEAEREQRDDEHPPPRPSSEPNRPAAAPPASINEPGDHRRAARASRRHGRRSARLVTRGQGRRCCGAYGSSATWRARLRATASSRWCAAQVPVLRRGSILARSDR